MFGLQVDVKKRSHGLDLARTIAISLVVFAHSLWISNQYPPLVSWFMQLSGTIGVEIFFIISGFLIGRIVFRMLISEDFSFKTIFVFLKRRWYRTLPNYYLILLVNLGLWYFIYEKIPEKLFLYFFYLQNITSTSPDFYRISWSLAVEQFCYILGPFLLLLLVRFFPKVSREKIFLWMCLFIIVFFFFVRIFFNYNYSITSIFEWNESLRKVTIYRLDAIYYGFVLFYMHLKGCFNTRYNFFLFFIGLTTVFVLHVLIFALGILVEKNAFFFNVFYLPINSIAISLMIPYLISLKFKDGFLLKIITLISILSYSIYLLHYTVILHAMKFFIPSEDFLGLDLFLYTFFYWFLVIFLSFFLYKFFEKPMTNLRD